MEPGNAASGPPPDGEGAENRPDRLSKLIPALRVLNAAFLVGSLCGLIFALFPGRFDGDAINQYRQGLALQFDDAHSVLDAALLGALSNIASGPGPMFVLQLALYVGGLGLLTDALIARGRPLAGMAISVLALLPFLSFDFLDIQKDALLSALLVILIGMGARRLSSPAGPSLIGGLFTAGVFLLAVDTRQNAIFALTPIWFLFQPLRRLQLRPAMICLAGALAVSASALVLNSTIDHGLLKAERRHLQYALIIFDLAGVTARTGQDASEGMLPDFKAEVARCYTPRQWDPFLIDPACSPANTAAVTLMQGDGARALLTDVWIKQALLHPAAYLAHRLENFRCLVRLGCLDVVDMNGGLTPRPWDEPRMRVTSAARALAAAAGTSWRGVLGSGALWILVLLAELGGSALRLRRHGFEAVPYMSVVLAAAGLLYTLSFAIFGVADQLRYMHPVMVLAIVGAPLALASHGRFPWRRDRRADQLGSGGPVQPHRASIDEPVLMADGAGWRTTGAGLWSGEHE